MMPATSRSFALADLARVEQLLHLGTSRRLFYPRTAGWDASEIPWCGRRVGQYWFGICGLGPGWVFDAYAQSQRSETLAKLRRKALKVSKADPGPYWEGLITDLQFGAVAERIFWIIHERILQAKRSVVRIPDVWFANRIWTGRKRPRHWRTMLGRAMESLCWLHLGEGDEDEPPTFGSDTALLTHAADLYRSSNDQCDEDCPLLGGPLHHHFVVNIGRGFLGILEGCATHEEGGTRYYEFPARGSRRTGTNLSRLGQTGQLASLYLPARLGSRASSSALTLPQHRLLQVLVRERTRMRRGARKDFSEIEVIEGNCVVDLSGRGKLVCPLLDANGRYVGFNGNKKRRGCGYLLMSAGGWLSKAGRPVSEFEPFLQDLSRLSTHLGLVVVGLLPGSGAVQSQNLDRMLALANSQATGLLQRLHLRVYAGEDYVSRWDQFFGWPAADPLVDEGGLDARAELQASLLRHGVSRKELAARMGTDPSALTKILNGKRRCTPQFLEAAQRVLELSVEQGVCSQPCTPKPPAKRRGSDTLAAAIAYLRRGWSVIPQQPRTKKAYVKWKEFQDRRPTQQQLRDWWSSFPEAGIAVICGPLSRILVIDVDGAEAREALVRQLGSEPHAPKVLSGSGDPNRFHLFFQHPDFGTRAKKTPWHPKLEFRGHAGLVVVPPSLHKSGNRYRWARGRSMNDIPIPVLPPEICDALRPVHRPCIVEAAVIPGASDGDVSQATAAFLAGNYAKGPKWNERLFRAACDLAGRGVPLAVATPRLLQGARPWNDDEREAAIRTVQSAYSSPRSPAVT